MNLVYSFHLHACFFSLESDNIFYISLESTGVVSHGRKKASVIETPSFSRRILITRHQNNLGYLTKINCHADGCNNHGYEDEDFCRISLFRAFGAFKMANLDVSN